MARYAIIRGGVVEGVAVWDGVAPWSPGAGATLVEALPEVGPGWTHDGQAFAAPEPEVSALTVGEMLATIDDEAERRIHDGPGFEFPPASGQFFSLSANAQSKWNAVMTGATLIVLGLAPPETLVPFNVRTKDDLVNYTVQDAATALAMCGVALGTAKAHLQVCNDAKGVILDAATPEDARAAFDAYMAGT